MLARFDGDTVTLQEMHRFPNRPVRVHGHLHWNMLGLWQEILVGLGKAHAEAGHLASIGVDTWAVDYGLIEPHGMLLGMPDPYRDHRTDGVLAQLRQQLTPETIYSRTGIQFCLSTPSTNYFPMLLPPPFRHILCRSTESKQGIMHRAR